MTPNALRCFLARFEYFISPSSSSPISPMGEPRGALIRSRRSPTIPIRHRLFRLILDAIQKPNMFLTPMRAVTTTSAMPKDMGNEGHQPLHPKIPPLMNMENAMVAMPRDIANALMGTPFIISSFTSPEGRNLSSSFSAPFSTRSSAFSSMTSPNRLRSFAISFQSQCSPPVAPGTMPAPAAPAPPLAAAAPTPAATPTEAVATKATVITLAGF